MMIEKFQSGCPWFDLNQKFPPNIEWCEEKVCSWFVTPFNAFTNLGYIFIGIYIWQKMKNSKSALLRFFGPTLILVGATSFVFHSSLNFFSQAMDYFGMYAFCMLLIMFNLSRMKHWPPPPKAFVNFWLSIFSLTALTVILYWVNLPYQYVILILILVIIATELMQKSASRKYFYLATLCLALAESLSLLDLKRVLCDPSNHWFQGHGVWHLLGSLSLWFSYQHYLQFEKEIW